LKIKSIFHALKSAIFGMNDTSDSEVRIVDGYYTDENGRPDTSSPTNEKIEQWQANRDAYLKDPYEKDPSTGLVRLKYNPMGICTSYTKDGYKLYEWHRPETDPMYYRFYPNEKPSYTANPSEVIDLSSTLGSPYAYCRAFVCSAGHATGDEYAKSSNEPHFDAALRMWRY